MPYNPTGINTYIHGLRRTAKSCLSQKSKMPSPSNEEHTDCTQCADGGGGGDDESSAPSGGGGGGTPGVTPGGRFGESNTKLDECYEEWKTSAVAAKLKAFLEEELR